MCEEKELDPTLKALEAELAALVPRTDRLDRQRLIFLAGQQSAGAARVHPATAARRWGWPAGFVAMTATAAALAVTLLLQPDPQVVVRYVTVPAKSVAVDPAPPEADGPHPPAEHPLPELEHVERLPDPLPAEPRPGGGILWASLGLWQSLDVAQQRWAGSPSRPRLIRQLLADGPDLSLPAQTTTLRSVQPIAAPTPYREFPLH